VAAHAGALELGTVGNAQIEAAVIVSANEYAAKNMNVARYGDVLVDNDIQTGYWNSATRIFTELTAGDVSPPNAVRVTTRQDGVNSSKVGTFFLRFVGFDAFTVATSATVERFVSKCEKDGLFAMGAVNMSTQETFLDDFCVHGEGGVKVAQQNFFELGTVVSMANLDDCGPSSGSCTNGANPGIEEALRQYSMTFGKIARIPTGIQELQDPNSKLMPKYITSTVVNTIVNPRSFDVATDLVAGAVNIITCNRAGGRLSLGSSSDPGFLISNMVIVGKGCKFTFDDSVSVEDTIIATDATGNGTFAVSSGVTLGRNDGCTQGGEVVLISAGNVNFSAKLSMYDVEMIVAGNVGMASNANNMGINEGTSIWAGGDIKVTTKHTFSGCNGATNPTFDVKYTLRYVE